jgi:hypothetical protein
MKKMIAAVFAVALATAAQADSVKLFNAVPITYSGTITTGSTQQPFSDINGAFASETSVYVVCDAASTATISSTADGSGSLVVDNFLTMNGVNNICTGGITQDGVSMCFSAWTGASWDFVNTPNSETMVEAAYGDNTVPMPAPYGAVAPLTVPLQAGAQVITFERWDTGGIVASTDVYFTTSPNCRATGPSIPAKVQIKHFANGKMLCIGNSAVQAHVNHGDDIDSIVFGCGK